eukprot:7801797-Alexandrium_andersonii.AAC.1
MLPACFLRLPPPAPPREAPRRGRRPSRPTPKAPACAGGAFGQGGRRGPLRAAGAVSGGRQPRGQAQEPCRKR